MGSRGTTLGLAGAAAVLACYLAWRPRMLTWGATPEEAAETLPGDDATPHARTQWTRAITIDAPPEQVWPWLVQMGIGRAGFYTHDRVERMLFRARYVEGRHSATRIHPELQNLTVGDRIYLGGGAHAPVTEAEPFRHLVTFETFVLRPLPGGRTRLIARYRGEGFLQPALHAIAPDAPRPARLVASAVRHLPGADLLARGFDLLLSDPLHHYMELGMLHGIKARAEGATSHADDWGRPTTRRPLLWRQWRPGGHRHDARGAQMSGTDPLAGSEETTFAPGGLTHQAFRAGSPG